MLWVMHLSWMVTLFPITGIVKVGTFVSDRIAVPASVGTSILMAYGITQWLTTTTYPRSSSQQRPQQQQRRRRPQRNQLHQHNNNRWNPIRWTYREWMLLVLFVFSWRRIHRRTLEWMNPIALLESSLRTCPRSAKSHLEYSKTLSGLYPSRTNLTAARWHLEQVEEIHEGYCDVHQQFAHVAIQEQRFVEFEERLTKAVICPYTMGGAMDMWKRYWQMALDPRQNSQATIMASKRRQSNYLKVIDEAIAQEQEQSEADAKSASPLIWNRKED